MRPTGLGAGAGPGREPSAPHPYMELMRHRVARGHGDEGLAGTVGLLREE